jgi:hypothetical protein
MMALYQYMHTNNPYTTITSDHSAGTGSLIRVALSDCFMQQIRQCCVNMRAMHHGLPMGRLIHHAGQIIAILLAQTVFCQDKAQLLSNYWLDLPANAAIHHVLNGSYTQHRNQGSYASKHLIW